ncbi:MAG: Asp-tRNA(Asn)/Glu-tRNA(Gln) amidotransferase subunit GatC [Hydrotalea flava]|uniref:Asp-tRNA(Asn)/Glu-tRNA(Gln) amidotransferase subunit GatC n=1 Tax=Hydrotalea TaxID=1004300 RepID=UPI0009438137|nr:MULTISPECIES: Asp-tRNA(Asn)/Glu-tRNA(Gln) amidotransferase subunit GatC [Hydrotalea]MBY0347133.1 Asp-tRNA(Asn)/Glu-tRNA(Gln) amidotransferase subunit GatC [Hydrotalea flava]NIM35248.1 Asp-tRNA(Asn)/Glu-tRNA(Gln) amidotransferase subunit GatC [Hydrotalea flava]NIM38104.1 Asp-tRNA(Asn)/Glu-tRNA(Gln) amidotransferase subunit GatC [Hydrotalea flava]NIN03267.1 Asp-tRNA(Asn)/Glu-tRNA(Gln) amidotransferase subunit GatC [Hydrotalea flava]NIN14962.1 Asp-tRNA(Asn)/Glu-tRNA(Gln) amidotransferase subun
MQVDKAMVEKLAHLSRLNVDEADMPQLISDLENMIAFVQELQAVDTTNVAPLMYVGQPMNVFREDEVDNQITQAEALKNAPLHNGDFFQVPTVIKK